MKKVTKIVTLLTGLVLGLASIPAIAALSKSNKAEAELGEYHMIEYFDVLESGVDMDGPLMARAGSVVDFKLAYDDENCSLAGVIYSSTNEDGTFAMNMAGCHDVRTLEDWFFVMPDEDVLVGAYCYPNQQSGDPILPIYNYSEDQDVVLNFFGTTTQVDTNIGLLDTADPGDIVFFELGFKPGSAYTWNGDLEIYEIDPSSGRAVAVVDVYDLGGMYGFVMPEVPVLIYTGVEAKGFLATFDSVENVYSVNLVNGSSTVKAAGSNPYFIKAFSTVRVVLKDTSKKKAVGLNIDGVDYLLAENTSYIDFDMPSNNVDIKVLTENIYYNFTAKGDMTAHYDYTYFVGDSSSGTFTQIESPKAMYSQCLRIYPTVKAGVEAKIKTFKYKAVSASYSTTCYSSTDNDGKTYYQISLNAASDYEFEVTEEYSPREITATVLEGSSVKFVEKVGNNWVERSNKYYYGDYVFAQIVCDDPECAIDSVVMAYGTSSYQKTEFEIYDSKNGVYKSKSTMSDYNYTLTYKAVKAVYKGYSFTGSYQGINIWNGDRGTKYADSSYSPLITETGVFYKSKSSPTSSNTFDVTSDGANTVKNGFGSVLVKGHRCLYGNNWLVADDGLDFDVEDGDRCYDWLIAYKTDDFVQFAYNLGESKSFVAVQVLDVDYNIVSCMFILRESKSTIYISGVEFESLDNNDFLSDCKKYNVKVNGAVIGSVNDNKFTAA